MPETIQEPLYRAPLVTLVEWVADCAAPHLSLWEELYPNDARPRQAIEALRSAAPYADLQAALVSYSSSCFWQDPEADSLGEAADSIEKALVAQGFAPFKEVEEKLKKAAEAAKQAAEGVPEEARKEKPYQLACEVAIASSGAAQVLLGGDVRSCVHNAAHAFRRVVLLAGGNPEEENQRQQKRLIKMIQAAKEQSEGGQDGNASR